MKRLSAKIILTAMTVLVLVIGGYLYWHRANSVDSVNSFAECMKAPGSQTLLTYPGQCITSAGKTFTDPSQKVDSDLLQ